MESEGGCSGLSASYQDVALMRTPNLSTLTCSHQAFDSEIFGGPVFRLDIGEGPESQINRELRELAGYARTALIKLISCRVDDDSPLAASLEAAGFRPVEELVVYKRPLPEQQRGDWSSNIVRAEESDREPCEELAARAFTHDRYHVDPEIADAVADTVKRRWVRNSFAGRSDCIFVARSATGIDGFIICLRDDVGSRATIDLIAVSETCRGQGVGRSLVAAAVEHYSGEVAFIQAGTQTRNVASCRLYSGLGFAIESRRRTYHLLPSGKVSL